MRSALAGCLIASVACVLPGCASAVHRESSAPVARDAASIAGRVGFQVVADPSAGNTLGDRQDFVAPNPVGTLARPVYPDGALATRSQGVIGVRVTIGPEGEVKEIADSPVVPSSPGPHAAAFREAVERAVRTWKFSEPHVDLLEDGNDLDGDGKPDYVRVVRSIPVSVFYDVRFEFAIVDGTPTVRSGTP